MVKSLSIPLAVLLVLVVLLSAAPSANSAEKYVLAWWREMGQNEIKDYNGAGSARQLVVHVFNEDGTPYPGVKVYNTYPSLFGATDSNGQLSFDPQADDKYAVTMTQPNGTTPASDVTPIMVLPRYDIYPWEQCHTYERWSNGYEAGYIYLKDATTDPIQFNAVGASYINCAVNGEGTFCETYNGNNYYNSNGLNVAPYTKSLAYDTINCANSNSDAESQDCSNPDSTCNNNSYGQTFIATGDRVIAASVRTIVDGTNPYTLNYQVFANGPGGQPITNPKRIVVSNGLYNTNVLSFGVNECPVVPGNTYYIRYWATTAGDPNGKGIKIQVTRVGGDTYTGGEMYKNDVTMSSLGFSGYDLRGYVVCGTYGSGTFGNIVGTVKDSSGVGISGAQVTVGSTSLSTFTDPSGNFSFYSVPTGLYAVTATALGYCNASTTANVTTHSTATVPIIEQSVVTTTNPNLVTNPGFETGSYSGWTLISGIWDVLSYNNYNQYPHSGTYYGGKVDNGVTPQPGMIRQTVSNLSVGQNYLAGAYVRTWYDGAGERPSYIYCQMGYDKAGGTDFNAATWSAQVFPFAQWQFIKQTFTATGTTATIYLSYLLQGTGGFWGFAQFDDVLLCKNIGCTCLGCGNDIYGALQSQDGTPETLTDHVVTAGYPTFTNAFYIEDAKRESAIRVVSSTSQYQGDDVTVTGTVGTDSTTGERVINATAPATLISDSNPTPEALFMTGKNVGGVDMNTYTKGVYKGFGLYNVGMLVSIFGKVTYRGTNFFYLDDGSGSNDGNGIAGATGVRVDTTDMANPTSNYVVIVNGIVTKTAIGTNKVRMVRPITQGDIFGY